MKLIRAIFRHSLLLAIVIGSGVAYYYRNDWLPRFYEKVAELRAVSEEYFPGRKGAEEMSEPEKAAEPAPAGQLVQTEPAAKTTDVAVDGSSGGIDMAVEPAAEPVPPVAQAPVGASIPAPDLSRYRPLEEDEPGDGAGSKTTPESAALDSEIVPEAAKWGELANGAGAPAVAPEADIAVEPAPVPPPATEPVASTPEQTAPALSDTREQLREDARSAFWMHDYQQAERDYKALAELDPTDPDAWGELGNLYFSQGKWDLAADAFYEAGMRLARMGEAERARDLLVIIRGLSPEKARQLEQQLMQAQGGAGN